MKQPADIQTQITEGMYVKSMKVSCSYHFIYLLFLQPGCTVSVFLRCIYSTHMDHIWARNLRNLFSKLLTLQNNQPPPCELRQNPLLNNDGIVHLEKKTGVGCHVYRFSLFAHKLFAMAWKRPILGPAGCPVCMTAPKISSSQWWLFFFLQFC